MEEINTAIFEKYLAGQLSPAEEKSVKTRLDQDEEFARDFEVFKYMQRHLSERKSVLDALSNLQEVHASVAKSNGGEVKTTRSNKWLLWVVLGLALAIAAYLLWNREIETPTPARPMAFADVYVEPEWPASRRGGNAGELFSNFLEHRSPNTIQRINELNLAQDVKARWKAEMFIYINEPDSALSYLNLIETPAPQLHDRLIYLEALAYWMQGDKASDISHLKEGIKSKFYLQKLDLLSTPSPD